MIDLEDQIIAFALVKPSLVADLGDISGDFTNHDLADLWRSMVALHAEHGTVPLPMLSGHKTFAPDGVMTWLNANLLGTDADRWPVRAWAASLHTERLKADATRKLEQAQAAIAIPGVDPAEAVSDARAALDEIGSKDADQCKTMDAVMLDPDLAEGSRVATGFPHLDRMTLGWEAKTLVVIAARPSVGKSALALCLLLEASRLGTPCGILSSEMSTLVIKNRMVAALSGVEHHVIRSGRALGPRDTRNTMQASADLCESPITIGDMPRAVAADVRVVHAKTMARYGSCPLVVVDYLQRLASYSSNAPREQVVADVAKELRNQARELDTCVVALAQRGRAQDGGGTNKRPHLGDLRESAVIEQEGDAVMFLWHESEQDRQAEVSSVKLTISKQRNGPLGDIDMIFDKRIQRFRERDNIQGGRQ